MEKITISSNETILAGEHFARLLKPGDVGALYGDLGSGKTTFVQGIAKGLDITRRIVSPTFLILKTYERGKDEYFFHADLYRMESIQDIESIGLKELLNNKEHIVIIEWPEKIEAFLPKTTKKVKFEYIDENKRKITYE